MLCTILLSLILTTWSAFAGYIIGAVSKVRDGDTFLIGNQPIRLCGIDAPERGTAAGKKATEWLKNTTKGRTIRCVPVGVGTVCDGRSKRTNAGPYRRAMLSRFQGYCQQPCKGWSCLRLA